MDNDLLYPEPAEVLEEAVGRHGGVFAFAYEAIDLAHISFARQRDFAATLTPGIPSLRRARNDINDDAWRYFKSVSTPLVETGTITDFGMVDGGNCIILPDGLRARLKKGRQNGETSNYRTKRVKRMGRGASRFAWAGETKLDRYIAEGLWIDVVFVAGESMESFKHVGIRFAMTKVSPFRILDPPTAQQLLLISPVATELVYEARNRLSA